MNNIWIKKAKIRQEEHKIREKYTCVNLKDHIDLVERVAKNGLSLLTKEERMIVRRGKPEPKPDYGLIAYCSDVCLDEIIVQEDLKLFLTLHRFSRPGR